MVLALLIIIGLTQILGIYAGVKVYRRISDRISFFFAGDGNNSEFTQLVDSTSQVLAGRISSSMMATMRGAAGGTTKAITNALESEAIAQDPTLGMVDMVAPNITKKLGKNPLALMALQSVLNKIGSGSVYKAGGDNGKAGDPPKFNL